jgi:hypothetical protein
MKKLIAFTVLLIGCSSKSSTTATEARDLTGFWSGKTVYSTAAECALLGCSYDSRMMIVQTGATVSGWYRSVANIGSTETPITGSIKGDTLSLLINSNQVSFTGALKFKILTGDKGIVATQGEKTLTFTKE